MLLDTALLFRRLLPKLRPDLVCDVGSMDGAHARLFRAALPEARIVAFEANPENARRMAADPALARDQVEVCPKAAWREDGAVEFLVERAEAGREVAWRRGISSTRARRRGSAGAVAVTAPAVRLDTFVLGLAPAPRRIALWIDVEGAGHDVLEGLRHVADRVALVHVEVEAVEVWVGQKLAADVDALMAGWGFVPLARGFWYAQRDVVYAHAGVRTAARGAIRPVVWEAWLRSYPRRWVEDRAKRGRRAGLQAEALAEARRDRRVTAALGEPIVSTARRADFVWTAGPDGTDLLAVPVAGPRGEGLVYAEAGPVAGRATLTALEVAVRGRHDLIALRPGV